MESRLYANTRAKSTSTYTVRGQGSNPRSTEEKKNIAPICFVFLLLDLVIYFANVWNEREADNTRERRDFEEDEVKSHIRLSSAQPFNCFVLIKETSP